MAGPDYVFVRGKRCIVAEVLFPKKVVYQGQIFKALEEGLNQADVVTYIAHSAPELMLEMADYPQLLDPYQYDRRSWPQNFKPTLEQARQRLLMYRSHFRGWSMYEVDGVFLAEEEEDLVSGQKKIRIDDERTQVIKLIFRLESVYEEAARNEGCYDVLEALLRWTMAEHMRLDHILPWSKGERRRFLKLHGLWFRKKRLFVENYYELVTKETKRWIDDVSLFIFGYLVRKFWEEVKARGRKEDEVWVVNWLNVNLNIVRHTQ